MAADMQLVKGEKQCFVVPTQYIRTNAQSFLCAQIFP